MGAFVVLAAIVGSVAVFLAVGRNQARRSALRSATVDLEVGPLGVRRSLADGREERVDWDEITEVEVLTARRGPHGNAGGVVILAGDEEKGCLVPFDRLETSGVLEALTGLRGFEVGRLVEAMQKPPATRTCCWSRGSGD